ncbi:MAG: FecR domain-containing protein [Planctomycetota bacterium]|jgi:ferric-dicitrate binding protein FerR (iron transport regulator)
MMTCEKHKNLIEKFIEGTINETQFGELKTHTQKCDSCRDEFERCVLLQDVVKDAFSCRTSAEQAGASLSARLPEEPNPRLHPVRFGTALFAGRRAAIAAGVLLAVGLLLGFELGRAEKSLTAQVPISIGRIEGTVLVRHEGSDIWKELESGSKVHLGDTFHSAAQSACRLEFEDKSTIDLNQNSMLVLTLYNGETQFFLEHGECTADLVSPHGPFFINTPHGRVEALGTEFTVTVTDE